MRSGRVGRSWGFSALSCALLLGCNSPETQRCKAEYDSSQKVVLGIDGSSIDSVSESLRAVDGALDACKAAQRSGEVDNLVKARAQIQAQHDALVKRAGRTKRTPLTADELARFKRAATRAVPQGARLRARRDQDAHQVQRSAIAEMPWPLASKYFESHHLKLTKTDTQLSAEYGAEKFTFTYRKQNDAGPPVCLAIVAAPGIPWQEVTTRASGVHPDRMKRDEPLKMGGRSVQLAVGGDATQAVVSLGECAAKR